MADYKFAAKAERDLEDIIDYTHTLEQWGPLQTHTYIDGLESHGQLLADNPDLGSDREALAKELLSFPYESHVLYYMKQAHGITIVRVLQQSMDPVKYL